MCIAVITTSWDDGDLCDLRLADLLAKYNIPATFYLPVNNLNRNNLSSSQIAGIAKGFDIGGHTLHHVNLVECPPHLAKEEISQGKKRLEDIVGREVNAFCYPHGAFNAYIVKLVGEAGFIGGRTTRFWTRHWKDPYTMGTTIYTRNVGFHSYRKDCFVWQDAGLFWFVLNHNLVSRSWDYAAEQTLDFVMKNGGVWHLWGHSWEIDRSDDWARLERVLKRICNIRKYVKMVNNSQLMKIRPAAV